ncbi:hypothetical protein RW115_11995 [Macrococcus capreoli]
MKIVLRNMRNVLDKTQRENNEVQKYIYVKGDKTGIEKIIDKTQRLNNIVKNYELQYESRNWRVFRASIFDIYEINQKSKNLYVLLYDVENNRYERRLLKNFLPDKSFHNYKKPTFNKGLYVLTMSNKKILIDFIDDFNKDYYLVHSYKSKKYYKYRKDCVIKIEECI